MKARNKQTGEIVEIERYDEKGRYTVFRNSDGELMNLPISFYDNFEEVGEDNESIDWEQRRYEIAKDILAQCAIAVNTGPKQEWMIGKNYKEVSAIVAIGYADALIAELRKEKK